MRKKKVKKKNPPLKVALEKLGLIQDKKESKWGSKKKKNKGRKKK